MANFDFSSFVERISRAITFGNQKTSQNIEKMAGSVQSGMKSNINNVNVFRQEAQKNNQT